MNNIIHGLIAALFGFACWCVWGMLTLISHTMLQVSIQPPAFTRLCVDLRPLLIALPVIAVGYCVYVWIRKADIRYSWLAFFAATMESLVLVMLPSMIAVLLPMIQFIALAGRK